MPDDPATAERGDPLTPDAIRALRERMGGLSQAEFARRLGVHPMTVSKWERTKDRRAPTGLYKVALLRLLAEHPPADAERSVVEQHGSDEWKT